MYAIVYVCVCVLLLPPLSTAKQSIKEFNKQRPARLQLPRHAQGQTAGDDVPLITHIQTQIYTLTFCTHHRELTVKLSWQRAVF